ncbi:hypothetical protein ACH24_03430 [Francisella persica ATCC VR-331]|uniref:DUF1656 domain-containing protein n=1 Tax=Francisella persica ATCC VR-331 TaxID=1086726 RepID=A0AAC8VE06_9GAMM|nr:DUF1656 domain-containing protein [Francisella persica]ALB01752.1 hypothetical protein ACH24_03430 [Francisella persica ATCC VR-331]ANH78056.1 hypothetical protein FSC845_06270 [Francisella persica ATCC VR-331]
MPVLTFDGLLFSPLLLFVVIAIILTVLTNLITPKVILKYTNLKLSWLNLAIFICYLGLVMFILGD